MEYVNQLKKELIILAEKYGNKTFGDKCLHPNELKNSSVIYNDISFNFQKDSWNAISNNNEYFPRTNKVHGKAQSKDSSVLEMQSSNSSDALAMNIFCHPTFKGWKGVKTLFNVRDFKSIIFGYKAKVSKTLGSEEVGDNTEVDVFINEDIIGEFKLTEADFASKEKTIVKQYTNFENIFYVAKLSQSNTDYNNYQLIRNILAASQHNSRFILFCDMRRPDLAKSFFYTVSCIKDVELRTKCEIMYWQDLAKVVGSELREFLQEKYGIY